jgi:hypothetical protein
MEVRFLVTPQDVYHYHLFGYRHLRQFRLWALYLLATGLLPVALMLLPFSPFHSLFPPLFQLAACVLFVVTLALNVALYKHFLRMRASMEPALRGGHRLLLGPAGIVYQSWRGELFLPWQQVRAIEQDTYNLYFLLRITGPLAGSIWRSRTPLFLKRVCIVPRWSFANPLDAGTFFDTAMALWAGAAPAQAERGLADRMA